MYYSTVGLLAMVILLIENYDIIFKRDNNIKLKIWTVYRKFLLVVLIYYAVDFLWGIFETLKMSKMLFIDTTLYFIAIAASFLYWTQYAVLYLDAHNTYGKILQYIGNIYLLTVSVFAVINIFTPIIFSVDEQCVYRAETIRYALLIVQITLLLLNSVYALKTMKKEKSSLRKRYRTIAFFSFIMAVFLTVQVWFSYLPLYSIAYMLGICILHTFVVNDEKEEYRYKIKQAEEREKYHNEELSEVRALAYRDALTGVKSKLAYSNVEKKKNKEIEEGISKEFAVAVFDVNDLKNVNDISGHDQGDQHLIIACRTICNHFKHSPIFRVGGDEFVAILEGIDYKNRQELNKSFNLMMEHPDDDDKIVVAMGISDYIPGQDKTLNDVFIRADRLMYNNKDELKKQLV